MIVSMKDLYEGLVCLSKCEGDEDIDPVVNFCSGQHSQCLVTPSSNVGILAAHAWKSLLQKNKGGAVSDSYLKILTAILDRELGSKLKMLFVVRSARAQRHVCLHTSALYIFAK
jgi:hypothetical protein